MRQACLERTPRSTSVALAAVTVVSSRLSTYGAERPGGSLRALDDPAIGIVAPLILNPAGKVEDSARKFPAPMFLFRKLLGATSPPNFVVPATPVQVDWLAGMFLVVTSEIFRTAGGFDEGYFLYYEDVDLCWRLQSLRRAALQVPPVSAVHDARRESHRNARYLLWHVSSMLRFFRKRWCAALRQ